MAAVKSKQTFLVFISKIIIPLKTARRYLKFVTVLNFCHFTLISPLMPLGLFVISLAFSARISNLYLVQIFWTRLELGLIA